MGELFLVHSEVSGNWVQFHRIFGSLPGLLETEPKFRLEAPTALLDHYLKVLERHEIYYKVDLPIEGTEECSVLLFSSRHFPDNYDYGQPYIVAKSFELLESK